MTTTIPDVPPAGARPDVWQDDSPLPYRVLLGEVRRIDGVDHDRLCVQPTAIGPASMAGPLASFTR
jgi:hypothetical protein